MSLSLVRILAYLYRSSVGAGSVIHVAIRGDNLGNRESTVSRNKFLKCSGASAILTVLSLMFFPGQALLADGRCIRFIDVPFVASYIQVPYWYPMVFAGVFLGSALLTVVFLLLAWIYRKRRGGGDRRENTIAAKIVSAVVAVIAALALEHYFEKWWSVSIRSGNLEFYHALLSFVILFGITFAICKLLFRFLSRRTS